MTSSLPQEARDAFDRFITTEFTTTGVRPAADHLAGHPLLQPRAGRRSTSPPASATRRRPTTRAATRRSRCCSPTRPAAASIDPRRCWCRASPRSTTTTSEAQRRALLPRVERRSSRRPRRCTRRSRCARCSAGTTRGSTSMCAPSGSSSGRDGDITAEPEIHDAHLEEVRSGHVEEPAEDTRRCRAGRRRAWDERIDELGRDYETAVLSWLAPDGFPLSVRVPIRVDRAARAIHLERRARRAAADRGPRLPHRPPPRSRLHLAENFQVRGDLSGEERLEARPAQAGRRLRAPEGSRGPLPRLHVADAPLLPPSRQASMKRALGARPGRASPSGNGSSPACQGPGT